MSSALEQASDRPELEARPAPPAEVPRSLYPSLGRSLLGLAAGLFVTVVVVRLFNPHIGSDVAAASKAAAEPVYLLGALACVAIYLAADAWSLVVLTKARSTAPSLGVVRIGLEAHFIGGASSFGGFEIPYQILMLRRLGMTGPDATSAVLVKGLVHSALLAVVGLVSLLPWVDSPITSLQRWLLLALTLALACVWAATWLWLRRPVGRGLLPQRFHARIDELGAAVRSYGDSRGVYVKLVALQLVYWLAMFGVLLFVLHALGWRGSPARIVTGQAVMQVLMPLSPLPGGAGVAEIGFLALIGPSAPPAIRVASLVLWRVFTWLVPVALGAVTLALRGVHHARVPERTGPVTGGTRAH